MPSIKEPCRILGREIASYPRSYPLENRSDLPARPVAPKLVLEVVHPFRWRRGSGTCSGCLTHARSSAASLCWRARDKRLSTTFVSEEVADSAVLYVLEPVRPQIDGYVLQMIRERTFLPPRVPRTSDWACATRDVACAVTRVGDSPKWEGSAALLAERVARQVASSASTPIRVPGRRTRGSRGQGRSTLGVA